jgi:hypothetical protein
MKIAAWMAGIIAGLGLLAFIALELVIGLGVEHESRKAMAAFAGDRIESLIAKVECQTCNLPDRNQAVWALGQLKDKRALSVLYKYRTGKSCDHTRNICQYEISKAIRWTEGNSYMAPQVWRILLSKDHRRA